MCTAFDAAPQPIGEDLFELGERAHGRLLDAFDRRAGRGAQADRDRHRLVVVEQQGRQVRAGREPVAAVRAGCRVDGVAELPEPVDVAAQRSGADLELRGELLARPELVRLQQREQAQGPSRRIRHSPIFPHIAVRI